MHTLKENCIPQGQKQERPVCTAMSVCTAKAEALMSAGSRELEGSQAGAARLVVPFLPPQHPWPRGRDKRHLCLARSPASMDGLWKRLTPEAGWEFVLAVWLGVLTGDYGVPLSRRGIRG